ncbi:MAG: hypothetical protein ACRYG4_04285 [Janthinobacterium lividum]
MTTTRVPAQPCPHCGVELSAATSTMQPDEDEAAPDPGDLTVCIKCGVILRFGVGMIVERLTRAQFDALPPEIMQQLAKVQSTIRLMHVATRGTA